VQALQSQFWVVLAPLANGHARQAHALGDRRVGFASTVGQNDLGTLNNRLRLRPRPCKSQHLLDLVLA